MAERLDVANVNQHVVTADREPQQQAPTPEEPQPEPTAGAFQATVEATDLDEDPKPVDVEQPDS